MSDPYFKVPSDVSAPAAHCYTITPNDSADLPTAVKGIYIGTSGNIKLELVGDTVGVTTIFTSVPVGVILPVRVRKIWATGTTASAIVGMY